MEIIYEDNDILLCRKPSGVATQTKRLGQQDMESLLRNYRAGRGEEPYIGIVHRLDQPVEGLMVFAKNSKAASELSKQVRERMIGKHYYAISANQAPQPEGMLENYLFTDKKSNVTRVVNPTDKNTMKDAKLARLEYRIVAVSESDTAEQAVIQQKFLYDITLHTGRQHQIRVQMAHMGCPLLGDVKYGETPQGTPSATKQNLALCSYRLEFRHPVTKKLMDFRIIPQGGAFRGFAEYLADATQERGQHE